MVCKEKKKERRDRIEMWKNQKCIIKTDNKRKTHEHEQDARRDLGNSISHYSLFEDFQILQQLLSIDKDKTRQLATHGFSKRSTMVKNSNKLSSLPAPIVSFGFFGYDSINVRRCWNSSKKLRKDV